MGLLSGSTLAKVAGVTVISSTLVLGALVTFNGSDTIDVAKEKITDFAERINLYESNETELVNRIVSLKEERDSLQSQMDLLGDKTPQEMQDELDAANAQIEELESQLQSSNDSGEQLAQRILELEEEVNKANDKTSELQTVLDETVVEGEPLSSREIDDITTDYIELSYTKGSGVNLEVAEGVTFFYSSPNYKLENRSGETITYQVEDGEVVEVGGMASMSVQGISGSETDVYITTTINGQTYKIHVIDPNA